MPRAISRIPVNRPKYILSLDDLPKVVEADGVVLPIYLSLDNAARCFGVLPNTLRQWIKVAKFPVLRPGGRHVYVNVKELDEWIAANTMHYADSSDDSEGS